MKLGTIMTMLGMGAVLAACDCCPQDKELRAVMDNFTQNEVPPDCTCQRNTTCAADFP